jgi:hypothetical protein
MLANESVYLLPPLSSSEVYNVWSLSYLCPLTLYYLTTQGLFYLHEPIYHSH